MMSGFSELWMALGFGFYLLAAAASCLAAAWILQRGDRARADRLPMVAALGITASWAITHAAFGPMVTIVALLEILRNLSWFVVIYQLFAIDGRHHAVRPIRPLLLALVFVEALQLMLVVVAANTNLRAEIIPLMFQLSTMFRVMVAVGALVLLHNLYVGATQPVRNVLRWTAAALVAMWAYDLNYFLVAYLSGSTPIELAAVRGLITTVSAIPLAVGSATGVATMRLRPSRSVAFQTLSLLLIAGYILVMAGVAQSLSVLGGDLGRLIQVGFVFAATVLALLYLPSQHLRGWVRVTAVKHLFQHRYDYRAEWLRFTRTVGRSEEDGQSLQERAIKAMADITDSPGGMLFLRDEGGGLQIASRWQWNDALVPSGSIGDDLIALFEERGFVVDLDAVRSGNDPLDVGPLLPDWLLDDRKAWAIVPLLHFDRLTGFILLVRPSEARNLDWEDFDLLRVVAQQLASYLAEHSGQEALMEAARFDEFNRRIAFVMHDIKNLASQLSLLARNAERHADKEEFRSDMLVTLRNSADKLNTLLARLNRYGSGAARTNTALDIQAVAERVVAQFKGGHPITLLSGEPVIAHAEAEGLEQALTHLVQNAIDATEDETPVFLNIATDGISATIELVDSGAGMTAEFVRNGLYKPFVSSKQGGFGIGAFEARSTVMAMGGRMDVELREGLGTRFVLTFPVRNRDADSENDSILTEVA